MSKAILILGAVVVLVVLIAGGSAFVLMSPGLNQNKTSPSPVAPSTQNPVPQPSTPTGPITTQPTTPSTGTNQIALTVTNPVNNATVVTPNIQVKGQTVPNADISVNEVDVQANTSGAFTANLTLDEGENPIVVTAVDASGNYSETELTVTYQPPS